MKTNVPFLVRGSHDTSRPAQDLALLDGRSGEVLRHFHLDLGLMRADGALVFNGWNAGASEMGAMLGCLDFAVSPNGKLLAAASMDMLIHLIDLEKGTERASLRGHAAGVIRLVFHPSGHRLYSLDTTGEVIAWPVGDPVNGQ